MSDGRCVCGHARNDHYEYVRNWHDQTRCRECDPHKDRAPMPVNYAMYEGTYEAAMDHAADHEFEPQP